VTVTKEQMNVSAINNLSTRGVTRWDGARGKNQV